MARVKSTESKKIQPLPPAPNYNLETRVLQDCVGPVAGIDEAGRGPLAGPVVAAAVILDRHAIPDGLNDSKKLSAGKRETLFEIICRTAHVSVASASQTRVDQINIRQATFYAMRMALAGLSERPRFVLIDGRDVPPGLVCPGEAVIKGDAHSVSIAAASIIAKVTRDHMMSSAGLAYPGYGFEKHMGYGTRLHMQALLRLGACPLHRKTFRPVSEVLNAGRE